MFMPLSVLRGCGILQRLMTPLEIERAETTVCPPEIARQLPAAGAHCAVERCINDQVLFVQCARAIYCAYQVPFGNGCICSNPLRLEIYQRRSI